HRASAPSRSAPRMNDALPTRERCEEIFELVAQAARSEGVTDVEVTLGVGSHALTRFANNTIHQNMAERGGHISVRALIEGRTARGRAVRASTRIPPPAGLRTAGPPRPPRRPPRFCCRGLRRSQARVQSSSASHRQGRPPPIAPKR